jgi:hypothetical protein
MVRSATGLHLSQLRLVTGQGQNANRGVNLQYGFGAVCWNREFNCHNRYLVVGEALGPGTKLASHVTRDRISSGSNGHVSYGPWKFTGSVSGRNLVITVYGSFSKATIRHLGLRLTGAHALSGSSASLTLSGSITGTEQRIVSVPDTGAQWRWQGSGTVKPLGAVTATGTNHAVGFIASGTPTGSMVLTGANGTLTLTLTYPQTKGFAPLPAQAAYVISGGTGQYAGASGSGSVVRKFGSCSPTPNSTSCSAITSGPVTYQFVASNGA